MPYLTLKDGLNLFYKDWGNATGQPVVFSHGWPLNADAWENQMFFLGDRGYRVIAHDRRGHGRSDQSWARNDINTWADDLHELMAHLNIKDATLVGHSTGGGEITRYTGRHGTSWVKKLVLISSITPLMLQTPVSPHGVPMSVFDSQRAAMREDRSAFFYEVPKGPFFGFNRPNATVSEGLIQNWFNQGMQASFKSTYDTIRSWETDFRQELKDLNIPVLVIHGDDDQVVPFAAGGNETIKLLKKGKMRVYHGGPHGLPSIEVDRINTDLLQFLEER
ncbi:alpha/beta-hydrolase [Lojkania enalia]|uniref:Alpha/beta-hydrolase n=1 Tax=Lojkania enalia TaxID=147567 RepID=A0A9P4N9E7_9PLEO|nr:alpha/beta-hydrolase [Didymosphaeria enalia]